MIPHLLVCLLGIGLLVLITAIIGLSELFRSFSVGLGIIIGGATLVGKTLQATYVFSHNKLQIKVSFCVEYKVTLRFPIVSRKEATGLLASLSYHCLRVSSAVTLTPALLYFSSRRS
jgi:hypothetical protein